MKTLEEIVKYNKTCLLSALEFIPDYKDILTDVEKVNNKNLSYKKYIAMFLQNHYFNPKDVGNVEYCLDQIIPFNSYIKTNNMMYRTVERGTMMTEGLAEYAQLYTDYVVPLMFIIDNKDILIKLGGASNQTIITDGCQNEENTSRWTGDESFL